MDIFIKTGPNSIEHRISEEEFAKRIASGTFGPTILFRHGDSWRTIDNLPEFHRHSRRDYPPGEFLTKLLYAECLSLQYSAVFNDLISELWCNEWTEKCFKLDPLDKLSSNPGCIGAARLIYRPAFDPEYVVTVLFSQNGVIVHHVKASNPAWRSLNDELNRRSLKRIDENQIQEFIRVNKKKSAIRSSISFPGRAPVDSGGFISREVKVSGEVDYTEFLSMAKLAVDCTTNTRDGISYMHSYVSNGTVVRTSWFNPDHEDHAAQIRVLKFYESLRQKVLATS